MHITIHTSQQWADTFISELNDTHVEAELRTRHIPPQVRAGGQKGGRFGPRCRALLQPEPCIRCSTRLAWRARPASVDLHAPL